MRRSVREEGGPDSGVCVWGGGPESGLCVKREGLIQECVCAGRSHECGAFGPEFDVAAHVHVSILAPARLSLRLCRRA